jgi:2-hydroxy-6-oxonona-2,4-dienedioate hydrolase
MSSAACTSTATGRWVTVRDLGPEGKHDTPFLAYSDRPRCLLPRPSPRRRLLDRWTVVGGDSIHSRETADAWDADARGVILVHGVGATARYFDPLLRELDGRAAAAAVELPGIGGSSASRLPRDIAQQADVLAAWLRATGRHPAVLVGNSMGAQTVVELAIRHPALVERLVLIGPTMDQAARSPLRQIRRLLVDATVERPSLIALTLADTFRTRRRAVYRYFRAALDHHIEERVPLVAAPILVVRGERDVVVPRRWARTVAAAAPQGRFVEVPGAAHAAHHGRPRRIAALLLAARSEASDPSRPAAR